MRIPLVLTTISLVLMIADPASAATYCIHQPSDPCPAGTLDRTTDVQGALDAAAATPAGDIVHLGAGTFTTGLLSYATSAGGFMELQGSGVGVTRLTGTPVANSIYFNLSPAGPQTRVDNLTLGIPPRVSAAGGGNVGIQTAGALEKLSIEGPSGENAHGANLVATATMVDSSIAVDASKGGHAVHADGAAIQIRRSSLTGGLGLETGSNPTPGITLDRVAITAASTGVSDSTTQGATFTMTDTSIRLLPGVTYQSGISFASGNSGSATLTADGLTIAGPGGPDTTGINVSGYFPTTANITLKNSVIDGFGSTIRREAGALGSTAASYSAADSATAGFSFNPGLHNVDLHGAGAGFVSASDLRPAAGSRLLDAGDPAFPLAAEVDIDGLPRAIDATGSGNALRDIGASERTIAYPLPAGTLLVNGDAETGPFSDLVLHPTPAGWIQSGTASAYTYGDPNFLSTIVGGYLGGGSHYFFGGNTGAGSLSQTVDVSLAAGTIDAGRQRVTLAGLLGGYRAELDAARADAVFLGADGAVLGQTSIGAVTPVQRANVTTLAARSSTATLPAGTRSIRVTLSSLRDPAASSSADNDGYLDNISLVPDPLLAALVPSTPAPPVTPRPPVLVRPFAGVSLRRGAHTISRARKLTISLTCPATATVSCTGTVAVRATPKKTKKSKALPTPVTLGSRSFSMLAGKTAKVVVTLTRAGLARFPGRAPLAATIVVIAHDGSARSARSSVSSRLVHAPKKRARKP